MINKHKVKINFSNAKDYDNFTSYHNLTLKMISQTIRSFFDTPKYTKNILDIGCGTAQGYFALERAMPNNCFNYFGLDFATGLLNEAKRKFNGKNNINNAYLICGDAESLPLKCKKFDVIFSNMALHWLNQYNIGNFLNQCKASLRDGGIIILSFLISGTLRELAECLKNTANDSIKLHVFPELEFINEKINETELKIECSKTFEYVETAESPIRLLKRMAMLGAKNTVNKKTPDTRSLRRMLLHYDKHYRYDNGRAYCTYKIAYIVLKKYENPE